MSCDCDVCVVTVQNQMPRWAPPFLPCRLAARCPAAVLGPASVTRGALLACVLAGVRNRCGRAASAPGGSTTVSLSWKNTVKLRIALRLQTDCDATAAEDEVPLPVWERFEAGSCRESIQEVVDQRWRLQTNKRLTRDLVVVVGGACRSRDQTHLCTLWVSRRG